MLKRFYIIEMISDSPDEHGFKKCFIKILADIVGPKDLGLPFRIIDGDLFSASLFTDKETALKALSMSAENIYPNNLFIIGEVYANPLARTLHFV